MLLITFFIFVIRKKLLKKSFIIEKTIKLENTKT